MKIKLGEALRYEQPTKYIVASEKYNDSYATPVLTAGKSFILGYTNEESGIYDNLPVIIFDDFTTDIKYVDFPFKVKSSAMKMLQPANENYNLKFFYYLIKYMNFQPTSHQRHWISKFAEMEFDIPERVKQDQIVEKLDKLVEMQSKKTTQLKKYDDLVKSQFIEMFGTSEYAWKYQTTKLENLASFRTGGTPDRKKMDQYIGTIPWITTISLGESFIGNSDAVNYISQKAINESSTHLIPADSVMLGIRVGVGKSSINKEPICTNQDIVSIYNIKDEVNSLFLKKVLDDYEKIFNDNKRGATIKGVTTGFVKNLDIPTPPIELQNQFAEFVKHIDKLKFTLKEEIKKLQECYNSLMKEYFE